MKFNNQSIISPKAQIGKNVKIGDGSIIYDNVIIGDNSIVSNSCVIGEPGNEYYYDNKYNNPITRIGKDALIRSHAIIYSGSNIGNSFSCGHRVTIREHCEIGDFCRIGTLSDLQGHLIIGDYCWLHSNVHIGQKSRLWNFIFIYPYVVLTNDPTPPSDICQGPTIKDFSQIAVHSTILPNVQIGEHVLIGANSLVNRDVDDYSLTAGNPAKHIKDVRDIKSRKDGKSHYPWPYNFERGMPWEGIGFDKWKNDYNDPVS